MDAIITGSVIGFFAFVAAVSTIAFLLRRSAQRDSGNTERTILMVPSTQRAAPPTRFVPLGSPIPDVVSYRRYMQQFSNEATQQNVNNDFSNEHGPNGPNGSYFSYRVPLDEQGRPNPISQTHRAQTHLYRKNHQAARRRNKKVAEEKRTEALGQIMSTALNH